MGDALHIVCLDAPAPPDYGGAIDMFYKIKSLAEGGKKIILHYFNYNNRELSPVRPYCSEIHAYPRRKTFPFTKPYIVSSRIHPGLIRRLNEKDEPVLLEGIHCTGVIPQIKGPERIIVRVHNDEARYYRRLAAAEKNPLKKTYFLWESLLLNKYQKGLPPQIRFACLSKTDEQVFKKEYGFQEVHFVPCFIPWQAVNIHDGMGRYCLYHGNLGVAENEQAALWLMENVFSVTNLPFTIAGKSISRNLLQSASRYSNVQVVPDPSIEELDQMVRYAQVNVLPSFNETGVKLKLLHVLLEGRYCLTNRAGAEGSLAEGACELAEEPVDFIRQVERLFHLPFEGAEKKKRQKILALYNNQENAQKLNALW